MLTQAITTMKMPYQIRYLILFITLVLTSTGYTQDFIQKTENVAATPKWSQEKSAEAWGITSEEYAQVNSLKIQYEGLLSANLTPLEWLGIFATSDEQRDHYAKLLAQRQFETTAAILKFETAYSDALKALHSKASTNTAKDERLLLITSLRCKDPNCAASITEGLHHVERGGSLEIYLQDAIDSTDLRTWVIFNQISQVHLQNGTIKVRQAKGRMLDIHPGIYRVK